MTNIKDDLLKIANDTKDIATGSLETLHAQGQLIHRQLSKMENINNSLTTSENIISKIEGGLSKIGLKKKKKELPLLTDNDTQYCLQIKKGLWWYKYEIRFTPIKIIFIRKNKYDFDIDYEQLIRVEQENKPKYFSIHYDIDKILEIYSVYDEKIINNFKDKCKLNSDLEKDNIIDFEDKTLGKISNVLKDLKELSLLQNEALTKQSQLIEELSDDSEKTSMRLINNTKRMNKI